LYKLLISCCIYKVMFVQLLKLLKIRCLFHYLSNSSISSSPYYIFVSLQALVCPSFLLFLYVFVFLFLFLPLLNIWQVSSSQTLLVMAYGCLSIRLFPLRFGVSGHTRNPIPSVWTTLITQQTYRYYCLHCS